MTRFAPSVARLRTLWFMKCVGNSLVGTAPPSRPHTLRHALPASLISTMPMLCAGSSGTLRKYLPESVVMKYSPARFSQVTPIPCQSPGTSANAGRAASKSSSRMR